MVDCPDDVAFVDEIPHTATRQDPEDPGWREQFRDHVLPGCLTQRAGPSFPASGCNSGVVRMVLCDGRLAPIPGLDSPSIELQQAPGQLCWQCLPTKSFKAYAATGKAREGATCRSLPDKAQERAPPRKNSQNWPAFPPNARLTAKFNQ